MIRITSRQHPIVRRCREVAARRTDDDAVLLDGAKLVGAAIDAGAVIEAVLMTALDPDLASRAGGADVYETTEAVLAAASPARTPSGVVAIGRWRPAPLDTALDGAPPLALGLVAVQDPGNMGSAIRAAYALGATGVLALDDSADPGGWKALRGAMGGAFQIAVARDRLDRALATARRRAIRVAAAVPRGGAPLDAADLTGPLLVLLGNEGAGLPDHVVDSVDLRLTIPMRGDAESLNVAVTAALVLWEARRQRARAAR